MENMTAAMAICMDARSSALLQRVMQAGCGADVTIWWLRCRGKLPL
jgi:hypothetical protein